MLLLPAACVDRGPGSDTDSDGIRDNLEDTDGNFLREPDESNWADPDTDDDGLCDGKPTETLAFCTSCEDCNDNGQWEPCRGETDPLNDDTDGDGIPDASDSAPLDALKLDCSDAAVQLPFGASLRSCPLCPRL